MVCVCLRPYKPRNVLRRYIRNLVILLKNLLVSLHKFRAALAKLRYERFRLNGKQVRFPPYIHTNLCGGPILSLVKLVKNHFLFSYEQRGPFGKPLLPLAIHS